MRGREKLLMDLDSSRLHDNDGLGLIEHRVVAALHKVAFSSRKVALAAKNEANCFWCVRLLLIFQHSLQQQQPLLKCRLGIGGGNFSH